MWNKLIQNHCELHTVKRYTWWVLCVGGYGLHLESRLPLHLRGWKHSRLIIHRGAESSVFVHIHVYRQANSAFIAVLNEVRLGRCNPEVVSLLRSTRNNKVISDHITHITVFISWLLILVTHAFFTCRLIYSLAINNDADALICLYECLGRWWLISSPNKTCASTNSTCASTN